MRIVPIEFPQIHIPRTFLEQAHRISDPEPGKGASHPETIHSGCCKAGRISERALGFHLTSDENKLILHISEDGRSGLLNRLKLIRSIIVFEIFYFAEFHGEILIEIEE